MHVVDQQEAGTVAEAGRQIVADADVDLLEQLGALGLGRLIAHPLRDAQHGCQ